MRMCPVSTERFDEWKLVVNRYGDFVYEHDAEPRTFIVFITACCLLCSQGISHIHLLKVDLCELGYLFLSFGLIFSKFNP